MVLTICNLHCDLALDWLELLRRRQGIVKGFAANPTRPSPLLQRALKPSLNAAGCWDRPRAMGPLLLDCLLVPSRVVEEWHQIIFSSFSPEIVGIVIIIFAQIHPEIKQEKK